MKLRCIPPLFFTPLLVLACTAGAPVVVPWSPARISSPQFESHAAFDPLTGDLYFVRGNPEFSGWRILVSHPTSQGWSEPGPAAFAGDGVEADPYFAEGGRVLYFISTRSTDGLHRKDLDSWRVDRKPDGSWGVPTRLPAPLNSPATEWYPRPAPDGWLYFGSNRLGGQGGNDIWRGRQNADGGWVVENLGPAINTASDEFEFLPSPDGTRGIVMARDGLYETRAAAGGWTPKTPLGAAVNQPGLKVGALFSPSGRSVLFARDTGAPASGEFFVLRDPGDDDWPPSGRASTTPHQPATPAGADAARR